MYSIFDTTVKEVKFLSIELKIKIFDMKFFNLAISKVNVRVCNDETLFGQYKAICPANYEIIPNKLQLLATYDDESFSCSNISCAQPQSIELNTCSNNMCYVTNNLKELQCKTTRKIANGFQFEYDCIPKVICK